MQVTPYLFFDGNCAEAFTFYAQLFGVKVDMMTHGQSPMSDQTPPDWKDKVLHARIDLGGTLLMGSDSPPQYFSKPQGFTVSFSTEAMADAERIFAALADGGEVRMPFEKTFWAERFGMVIDRFGIPWMINLGPA